MMFKAVGFQPADVHGKLEACPTVLKRILFELRPLITSPL
jgi:hypothetical protein